MSLHRFNKYNKKKKGNNISRNETEQTDKTLAIIKGILIRTCAETRNKEDELVSIGCMKYTRIAVVRLFPITKCK